MSRRKLAIIALLFSAGLITFTVFLQSLGVLPGGIFVNGEVTPPPPPPPTTTPTPTPPPPPSGNNNNSNVTYYHDVGSNGPLQCPSSCRLTGTQMASGFNGGNVAGIASDGSVIAQSSGATCVCPAPLPPVLAEFKQGMTSLFNDINKLATNVQESAAKKQAAIDLVNSVKTTVGNYIDVATQAAASVNQTIQQQRAKEALAEFNEALVSLQTTIQSSPTVASLNQAIDKAKEKAGLVMDEDPAVVKANSVEVGGLCKVGGIVECKSGVCGGTLGKLGSCVEAKSTVTTSNNTIVEITNPGGQGGGTTNVNLSRNTCDGTGNCCNCGSAGTFKLDASAGDCARYCGSIGGSLRGAYCNGAPVGSVDCNGCPDGQGKVCQSGGVQSGCVRAHACGFTGNISGLCVNDGQCDGVVGCSGGSCTCQGGQCTKTATGIAQGQGCGNGTTGPTCASLGYVGSAVVCQSRPNAPAACVGGTNIVLNGDGTVASFKPTNQIFVGCGNAFGQDSCSNCYQKDGAVTCVREATSCGTKEECYGGVAALPITTSTQLVQLGGGDPVAQQVFQDLGEGGGTTPPPGNPPPPPPTAVACGSACTTSSDCYAGHTCSAGVCKMTDCVNNPASCHPSGCAPLQTVACGAACTADAQCATGFSCSGGTCKLDSCIASPGSCDGTGCNPTVCGDGNVDTGEECGETGLTCGSGESCVTNSCVCVPAECGESCGQGGTCPGGMTCNGSNICVLDYCLVDGRCSDDACTPLATPLPTTALISDDVDRVILALGLLIVAFGIVKFRVIDVVLVETGMVKPGAVSKDAYEKKMISRKGQRSLGIMLLIIVVAISSMVLI